ncbi:MAG: ComEC family competence protein [Rhodospirillaceae bacterium]|nr:ComEC family competence protein [Rhodospirillaceae bacterium]
MDANRRGLGVLRQQIGIKTIITALSPNGARWLWLELAQALAQERERWVLWIPVFCGAGIAAYFYLNFEPPLWVGPALTLIGIAGTYLSVGRENSHPLVAIVLLFLGIGFSSAQFATWSADGPLLENEIGPVDVSGQIKKVEYQPKSIRVTLEKVRISTLAPDKIPNSVRIVMSAKQSRLTSGDWIRIRATLKPPSPPAMPGAFDFQRQSFFNGPGAVGFSFGRAVIEGSAPKTGTKAAAFYIEQLRENINASVRETIEGEKGAVASALMTGDRAAIGKDVMAAMRDSGLAHLLAISGLHVGLVAGILFFSVRALLVFVPGLVLNHPVKKWAAVVAIIGALGYAIISGATVPTQRAFLMLAFVLLAVIFDRQGISMRVVAWAAMAIMLVSPQSILGASFQLSFAAVIALVAFYEEIREREKYQNHQRSFWRVGAYYVLGVAMTTLVAGLATAPFAAFHFNSVATFGLLGNLLAVPLTAIWIMPAAVASFVLMPFGLEGIALHAMGAGVEMVIWVAKTVSSMPGAVRVAPAFPMWGLALVIMGGLWVALWKQKIRILGFPIVVLGMTSSVFMSPPDIIVSSNGELAAIKTTDGGYVVSTLSKAKFERNIWLRRAGLNRADGKWPKNGKSGDVSCDGGGCIFSKQNHNVSFVRNEDAFAEDCASAEIIFAMKKGIEKAVFGDGPRCTKPELIVTMHDLEKNGAYAIWLKRDGVRVQTVNEMRGNRPWVNVLKKNK